MSRRIWTLTEVEIAEQGADRERKRIRRAQNAELANLRHLTWCKTCDAKEKLDGAIAALDAATRKGAGRKKR